MTYCEQFTFAGEQGKKGGEESGEERVGMILYSRIILVLLY